MREASAKILIAGREAVGRQLRQTADENRHSCGMEAEWYMSSVNGDASSRPPGSSCMT